MHVKIRRFRNLVVNDCLLKGSTSDMDTREVILSGMPSFSILHNEWITCLFIVAKAQMLLITLRMAMTWIETRVCCPKPCLKHPLQTHPSTFSVIVTELSLKFGPSSFVFLTVAQRAFIGLWVTSQIEDRSGGSLKASR